MTIDERLEFLLQSTESLHSSVHEVSASVHELRASVHEVSSDVHEVSRTVQKMVAALEVDGANIQALARIAEAHERRISNL